MPNVLSLILLALVAQLRYVSAICYNPDGSPTKGDLATAFQPCNQVVGTFSMCCGTNWTGGTVGVDFCQPNGLCLNSLNNAPLYWRSSCSDPTWKSPNCLANLCTNVTDGGDPTQNVPLKQCSDGSWCCSTGNDNSTACCEEKKGTFIASVIGAVTTSSSTAASTTSSSTSSPTSSPTSISSTSTPNNSTATISHNPSTSTPTTTPTSTSQTQPEGMSTGAKIGLGVGIALGVLILAGAIKWWTMTRKQKALIPRPLYPELDPECWPGHELPAPKKMNEMPEMQDPSSFQHEVEGSVPPPVELPPSRYSRGMGDSKSANYVRGRWV